MTIIDEKTRNAFGELIGKTCCRKRVGRSRSLSVGFGKKISHSKPDMADTYYGEWEIGTYSSPWRITCDEALLCSSMDVVKSFKDLDGRLQALIFGKIESVESVSPFDIQVKLEGGVFIEIFGLSTHDDEIFHIFGPDDLYVEFKIVGGWTIGKSNVPWTYS